MSRKAQGYAAAQKVFRPDVPRCARRQQYSAPRRQCQDRSALLILELHDSGPVGASIVTCSSMAALDPEQLDAYLAASPSRLSFAVLRKCSCIGKRIAELFRIGRDGAR